MYNKMLFASLSLLVLGDPSDEQVEVGNIPAIHSSLFILDCPTFNFNIF